MYKVVLTKKAKVFYANADSILAKKLAKCFEILENNPFQHPNIKSLKGELKGYSRYPVGDYRIVYEINNQTIQVIIIKIAHRKNVYE